MRLQPHILCLTANNPSPYTGPGSNSFLIFAPQGRAVLVDAGPDLPDHRAALIAALGGAPLAAIFLTHMHSDHAGGAKALSQALGAPIYAIAPGPSSTVTGPEDMAALTPDVALSDGTQTEVAGLVMTSLHMPGHTPDHACFALGDVLFSGDHVMSWASTLVAPPQGNMAVYRANLHRLLALSYSRFLPGHGRAITRPQERLHELIAHRAQREAQIVAELSKGPANALSIAQMVYSATPPALLPGAALNTLAHLIELRDNGRAFGPEQPDVHAIFTL
jgi:glyoxylase-like metal-dependent hydrolase (beta-lactamase superfamily II)